MFGVRSSEFEEPHFHTLDNSFVLADGYGPCFLVIIKNRHQDKIVFGGGHRTSVQELYQTILVLIIFKYKNLNHTILFVNSI